MTIPVKKKFNLKDIKFDETIYPRKQHDTKLVEKYQSCLAEIEAKENLISVSKDGTLLDGKHRWLAYRQSNNDNDIEIQVFMYDVESANEKFALAVELNSSHGYQLITADKKQSAHKLYSYGYTQQTIAKMLSVSKSDINKWLKDTVEKEQEKKSQFVTDLWLACYTQEEIATMWSDNLARANAENPERITQVVDIDTLIKNVKVLLKKYNCTILAKSKENENLANFQELGYNPPLYNVWAFAKKTNQTSHFGNSEQAIVDNLLYLYTKPFDVVVDPFAGGGSTIDVCKKRFRRYFVSDRIPKPSRENEIRNMDAMDTLNNLQGKWKDVSLVYLDPPYWKQAEGQYSKDAEDLANMSLEDFTLNLYNLIKGYSEKMREGAHIAMIIQPTQWKAENKQFTDHIIDQAILNDAHLELAMRIQVPYSTEQCTPQMVNWAKDNRQILVLSREVVVWRVIKQDARLKKNARSMELIHFQNKKIQDESKT